MSFQVLRKNADLVCLSTASGPDKISIEINKKRNSYIFSLENDYAYARTEQGILFREALGSIFFHWKYSKGIGYYSFRTLEDVAQFCTSLYWKGWMDQAAFDNLKPFFDAVKQTGIVWDKVFFVTEHSNDSVEPEVIDDLAPHGALEVLGSAFTLNLYLDSNRDEVLYLWLKMIAKEPSPRKCLGELFLRMRQKRLCLSEETLSEIWKSYGSLLKKIEQKSHVAFLLDLLRISSGSNVSEIVKVLLSQHVKPFRRSESQLILQCMTHHAELGDVFAESLKINPLHIALAADYVQWLANNASIQELIRQIQFIGSYFSLEGSSKDSAPLLNEMHRKIVLEDTTVATLEFQSMLFADAPAAYSKELLKQYDEWLDKLFKMLFDQGLSPVISSLIKEISSFQREAFPQFAPGLRSNFDFEIKEALSGNLYHALSVKSVLLSTVTTVATALRMSKKAHGSDNNQVNFDKFWNQCLALIENREVRVRLYIHWRHQPVLYEKFIDKVMKFRSKNENASIFAMGLARYHLMHYIKLFPENIKAIATLLESLALMRMPGNELVQKLHQQIILADIQRHFVFFKDHLDLLPIYKLGHFAGFNPQFVVGKKDSHRLKDAIALFVANLLKSGTFYHLHIAQVFVEELKCPAPLKAPLEDQISKKMDAYLDVLIAHPAKIRHALAVYPGFIVHLFEKFERLPVHSEAWKQVFDHFNAQLESAEDLPDLQVPLDTVVNFLRMLEHRVKDGLGITAGRAVHLTLYRSFLKQYSKSLEECAGEPKSERSEILRKDFASASRDVMTNRYLIPWFRCSDVPLDMLWGLFELHHDIYIEAVTEDRWFYELLTTYTMFSTVSNLMISDQEKFLAFRQGVLDRLLPILSASKYSEYVEAVNTFILKAVDENDEEASLNALNLLQLVLISETGH